MRPVPTTTSSVPTTTTSSETKTQGPTTTTSPTPTKKKGHKTKTKKPKHTHTKKPKHSHTSSTSAAPPAIPTDGTYKDVTDLIETLHGAEKDNLALKIGLGVGLGVGIPGAAALGWVTKTLAMARGAPEIASALSESLPFFSAHSLPFGSGSPGSGSPGSGSSGSGSPGSGSSGSGSHGSGSRGSGSRGSGSRGSGSRGSGSRGSSGTAPEGHGNSADGSGSDGSGSEGSGSDESYRTAPENHGNSAGDATEHSSGSDANGNSGGPNANEHSSEPGNEHSSEPGNEQSSEPGNEQSSEPGNEHSSEPDFANGEGGAEVEWSRALGSEVSEDLEQLRNQLRDEGLDSEEIEEILEDWSEDMSLADSELSEASGASEVVEFAANQAFGGFSFMDSLAFQRAADVAASGAGAEELADALLAADVPSGSVASTSEAISAAIKALPQGASSSAASKAAIKVIQNAVTPQTKAIAQAASTGLSEGIGKSFADSLLDAGVPADAVDDTMQAAEDAIRGARASGETGIKLRTAAIDAISRALPPDFFEASSGGLSAPSEALSAPSEAVSTAFLNVVGSSYNFWHEYPNAVYRALKKLESKKHSKTLAKILANGPPPPIGPWRDITFKFQRKSIPSQGHNGKVLPGGGKGTAKSTSTTPSAPTASTEAELEKVDYCANLPKASLEIAKDIDVGDGAYHDTGVNKTSLTEFARDDPILFTKGFTQTLPVSLCGIQTNLKSPNISDSERDLNQAGLRMVLGWLKAYSEVNAAVMSSDSLDSASPDERWYLNDLTKLAPVCSYVPLFDVPRPTLPYGRTCAPGPRPHNLPPEAQWDPKRAHDTVLDKAVNLFKTHRNQYLEYLWCHPYVYDTTEEVLQDAECRLQGTLDEVELAPSDKDLATAYLSSVQGMLSGLQEIPDRNWEHKAPSDPSPTETSPPPTETPPPAPSPTVTSPPDTTQFSIKVPDLYLPAGRLCSMGEAEFTKKMQDRTFYSKQQEFLRHFIEAVDFFKLNRDYYLLYMKSHPDELARAVDALDDSVCSLPGFIEKYHGNNESWEYLASVKDMLNSLREIQRA